MGNIRLAKIVRNSSGQWFLQVAKCYDLTPVNVSWQNDEMLGNWVMEPEIDILEELIPCRDEADAFLKMATFYKDELDGDRY